MTKCTLVSVIMGRLKSRWVREGPWQGRGLVKKALREDPRKTTLAWGSGFMASGRTGVWGDIS